MKTVVIGVTSSIACYKVVELVKRLKKQFNVEVIMSSNAQKLIDKGEFENVVKHYEKQGYDVKIIGIGENIRLVNTLQSLD